MESLFRRRSAGGSQNSIGLRTSILATGSAGRVGSIKRLRPLIRFLCFVVASAVFLWLASLSTPLLVATQESSGPAKTLSTPAKDTPGSPTGSQVLRMNVELTLVNVTVTDPYDRTVSGLDADNFRVFEDNVEQEVVNFSTEDVPLIFMDDVMAFV